MLDNLKLPGYVLSLGQAEKTQVEVKGVCRKCAAEKKPGAKTKKKGANHNE